MAWPSYLSRQARVSRCRYSCPPGTHSANRPSHGRGAAFPSHPPHPRSRPGAAECIHVRPGECSCDRGLCSYAHPPSSSRPACTPCSASAHAEVDFTPGSARCQAECDICRQRRATVPLAQRLASMTNSSPGETQDLSLVAHRKRCGPARALKLRGCVPHRRPGFATRQITWYDAPRRGHSTVWPTRCAVPPALAGQTSLAQLKTRMQMMSCTATVPGV